jgi:hypothetical protein
LGLFCIKRAKKILEKIHKKFDPGLVVADRIVGLLSAFMQPYKNKDFLIYILTIKTSYGGAKST